MEKRRLECTLVGKGNDNFVVLFFNRPLVRGRTLKRHHWDPDVKKIKKIETLRQRLEFLALGSEIKFETSSIDIENHNGSWQYFMPDVIAYLKKWWKEDFTIAYDDQRRDFDTYGEMGENIRRIPIYPIDYGIKFDSILPARSQGGGVGEDTAQRYLRNRLKYATDYDADHDPQPTEYEGE